MIDLRQLNVLRAVRDEGSLSRAAASLHVSLPTAIHHLDALERGLGARLVQRSPRGATLTPAGAVLAEESDEIFERLAIARQRVSDVRIAGLVVLRIGTFTTAGARLLPPALAKLTARVNLALEIEEGEPTYIAERVRRGQLHAALIHDVDGDPTIDHPDLRRIELDVEPFVVITAQDDPEPPTDFADLAERRWIRSHDLAGASERQLIKLAEAAGFDPQTLIRTDDYGMVHGFVAAGLGVALVSKSWVDPRARVTQIELAQDLGARRIAYITPADRPERAAVLLGRILEQQ